MNTPFAKTYEYRFTFQDGEEVAFEVQLNAETLAYIAPANAPAPDWARLETETCQHCPLAQAPDSPTYCPIARNIAPIVEAFTDHDAHEKVEASIHSSVRAFSKEDISLQVALSSLLGIIMVTSGCLDMDRLRPMVRFHLPFATIDETIYRTVSTYLMAQYYRQYRGLKPDWELRGLVQTYKRVMNINQKICERLRLASNKDANVNAVVILDAFAQMMPISIKSKVAAFESLFGAYLEG